MRPGRHWHEQMQHAGGRDASSDAHYSCNELRNKQPHDKYDAKYDSLGDYDTECDTKHEKYHSYDTKCVTKVVD
eukprot:9496733-Pyramimonas_sp.AAC.1